MTQFSIQHASEIVDGPQYIIHASHLIDNFNAIISDLADRLSLISASPQTIAGPITFTLAPTFSAGFSTSGALTLAGTVSITGNLALGVSSDPASPATGSMWYNSTSNLFKSAVQVTTVAGATNASPIVINTTGLHGLSTGDKAFIASVVGNTAANGSWTVTVVDPVTFSLNGSTGNGAYTSGGTVSAIKQVALAGYVPPATKGHLWGLTLSNNGTTPTTDIDIAAGQCLDDTGTDLMVYAGGTKRLSSSWAVGTGNGGTDTGTIPTSGTLHIFIIKRTDTNVVDSFASTSLTPTLPTGYTLKRRIASLTTDSSAHMIGFVQHGDEFLVKDPVMDINATDTATASTRTLSIPTGITVKALLDVFISTSNPAATYISSLDVNDDAPSTTATIIPTVGSDTGTGTRSVSAQVQVWTNTSAQVRSRSSGSTTLRISTMGWVDNRGRTA